MHTPPTPTPAWPSSPSSPPRSALVAGGCGLRQTAPATTPRTTTAGSDRGRRRRRRSRRRTRSRIAYQAIPNGDLDRQAAGLARGGPARHRDRVEAVRLRRRRQRGDHRPASIDIGLAGSRARCRAASRNGIAYQVPWIHDVIGEAEALVVKPTSIARHRRTSTGKTIATPFASTAHYSLLAALDDAGVDPTDGRHHRRRARRHLRGVDPRRHRRRLRVEPEPGQAHRRRRQGPGHHAPSWPRRARPPTTSAVVSERRSPRSTPTPSQTWVEAAGQGRRASSRTTPTRRPRSSPPSSRSTPEEAARPDRRPDLRRRRRAGRRRLPRRRPGREPLRRGASSTRSWARSTRPCPTSDLPADAVDAAFAERRPGDLTARWRRPVVRRAPGPARVTVVRGVRHAFGAGTADGSRPSTASTSRIEPGEFVCARRPVGLRQDDPAAAPRRLPRPDRGRVTVGGDPVAGPGPGRGVVFQQPNLYPWLTRPGQRRASASGCAGRHARERRREADALLDRRRPRRSSATTALRAVRRHAAAVPDRPRPRHRPRPCCSWTSRSAPSTPSPGERLQDELRRLWLETRQDRRCSSPTASGAGPRPEGGWRHLPQPGHARQRCTGASWRSMPPQPDRVRPGLGPVTVLDGGPDHAFKDTVVHAAPDGWELWACLARGGRSGRADAMTTVARHVAPTAWTGPSPARSCRPADDATWDRARHADRRSRRRRRHPRLAYYDGRAVLRRELGGAHRPGGRGRRRLASPPCPTAPTRYVAPRLRARCATSTCCPSRAGCGSTTRPSRADGAHELLHRVRPSRPPDRASHGSRGPVRSPRQLDVLHEVSLDDGACRDGGQLADGGPAARRSRAIAAVVRRRATRRGGGELPGPRRRCARTPRSALVDRRSPAPRWRRSRPAPARSRRGSTSRNAAMPRQRALRLVDQLAVADHAGPGPPSTCR